MGFIFLFMECGCVLRFLMVGWYSKWCKLDILFEYLGRDRMNRGRVGIGDYGSVGV